MATLKSKNAVEVSHLGKSFGANLIFRDASVVFNYGFVNGLVGPNGSGKTLLLNIIAGLDSPDCGTIELNGVDITRYPPHRIARLGAGRTFQYPNIAPTLTVQEYVVLSQRLPLRQLIRGRPSLTANALSHLSRFALDNYLDRPFGQLSFGQQKIVEIIALLLAPSSVILMDEPTAGLSSTAKVEIASMIHAWINPERAVIMAEHDMQFLSAVATRVAVIEDGAIAIR